MSIYKVGEKNIEQGAVGLPALAESVKQRGVSPSVPCRVRVLSSCGPGEINGVISTTGSTNTLGLTGWELETGTQQIEPDYQVYLRGGQSLKITNATANLRFVRFAMPETAIDPQVNEGFALPTIRSGMDIWLHVEDVAAIAKLDVTVYEDADRTKYRRIVLGTSAMIDYYGLIPGQWCCIHLTAPKMTAFDVVSRGANYPSPLGWLDDDCHTATYDDQTETTTITCYHNRFHSGCVGRGLLLNGGTTRYPVLALAGEPDENGLYGSLVVDGNLSLSGSDKVVQVLYPALDYPVAAIRIGVQGVADKTAIVRIGQIVAPESDVAVIMPVIDEPYTSGCSNVDRLCREHGFGAKGTFAVNGVKIGRDGGTSNDCPTPAELAAYEAAGHCLVSHSWSHYYSAPGTGVCNTDGVTVTRVSGTAFNTSGYQAGVHRLCINGVAYAIQSINSADSITLATSAGTQSGVRWDLGMSEAMSLREHDFNAAFMRRLGLRQGRPMYCVPPNNSIAYVATGTCTVAAGVVTWVSGDKMRMAGTAERTSIIINGVERWIATADSPTQITLADTSITEESPVAWIIIGGRSVASSVYSLCSRMSYGRGSTAISGSDWIDSPLSQRELELNRASMSNAASIDTVLSGGMTFREYIELAIAAGACLIPYTHKIEDGQSTSDAPVALWNEAFALYAQHVTAGRAVVWNWDDWYAFSGGKPFDHTYYGRL